MNAGKAITYNLHGWTGFKYSHSYVESSITIWPLCGFSQWGERQRSSLPGILSCDTKLLDIKEGRKGKATLGPFVTRKCVTHGRGKNAIVESASLTFQCSIGLVSLSERDRERVGRGIEINDSCNIEDEAEDLNGHLVSPASYPETSIPRFVKYHFNVV